MRVDQLVGVVHLLDRFLALLLGELGEAPVVEQAVVQPVLVDGAELELQRLVKLLDDLFLPFIVSPLQAWSGNSARSRNSVSFRIILR